jgi:hypothetical protein
MVNGTNELSDLQPILNILEIIMNLFQALVVNLNLLDIVYTPIILISVLRER